MPTKLPAPNDPDLPIDEPDDPPFTPETDAVDPPPEPEITEDK